MCSAFKFFEKSSEEGRMASPLVTEKYVELTLPLGETTAIVLYYLPKSARAIWVATCWDECFERFFQRPCEREELQRRLREWPTLGVLLWSGRRNHYRRGALIKAPDRDTSAHKWMLVCEVANVNLENAEELFGPATHAASQIVVVRSLQLRNELRRKRGEGFSFFKHEDSTQFCPRCPRTK